MCSIDCVNEIIFRKIRPFNFVYCTHLLSQSERSEFLSSAAGSKAPDEPVLLDPRIVQAFAWQGQILDWRSNMIRRQQRMSNFQLLSIGCQKIFFFARLLSFFRKQFSGHFEGYLFFCQFSHSKLHWWRFGKIADIVFLKYTEEYKIILYVRSSQLSRICRCQKGVCRLFTNHFSSIEFIARFSHSMNSLSLSLSLLIITLNLILKVSETKVISNAIQMNGSKITTELGRVESVWKKVSEPEVVRFSKTLKV